MRYFKTEFDGTILVINLDQLSQVDYVEGNLTLRYNNEVVNILEFNNQTEVDRLITELMTPAQPKRGWLSRLFA